MHSLETKPNVHSYSPIKLFVASPTDRKSERGSHLTLSESIGHVLVALSDARCSVGTPLTLLSMDPIQQGESTLSHQFDGEVFSERGANDSHDESS